MGRLLFLDEDVDVEVVGREGDVVLGFEDEGLAGHVAVVVAGDGEGGGDALDGVVVGVLFGVFVVVFEGLVAPEEGAAEGEVGGGVDVESDGVVVVAEDGDLVGEAALDHGGAFGDDDDAGGFEPCVVDGFDGVVAAAVEVDDLLFGELALSFVGDLVAFARGPDLDDVDLFAGEDHAFVGEEADAVGFEAVGGGELMRGVEVDDDAGGSAAEEACEVAALLEVFAVEPEVAAEGFEHLVEEFAAALLGGLAGDLSGGCAGDVGGLRPEGVRGDDADRDGDDEDKLLHGAPF